MVDNGSKFYARSTDGWAYDQGVRLEFSRPGKPIDNPFIESFSGRLRDEHLNVELFFSAADAQQKLLGAQLAGKPSPSGVRSAVPVHRGRGRRGAQTATGL